MIMKNDYLDTLIKRHKPRIKLRITRDALRRFINGKYKNDETSVKIKGD